MNKALKKDLERQAGQIEKIAQDIAAADRAELFEHDQVARHGKSDQTGQKSA